MLTSIWTLLMWVTLALSQSKPWKTQEDLSSCGEACVNDSLTWNNGCSILDNACNCQKVKDCAAKNCTPTESAEASDFIDPFCISLEDVFGDQYNSTNSQASATPTPGSAYGNAGFMLNVGKTQVFVIAFAAGIVAMANELF